jgi:hypothetical protein
MRNLHITHTFRTAGLKERILTAHTPTTATYLKHTNKHKNKKTRSHGTNEKGKAIPLQALTGPYGPRRLRLTDF